MNFRDILKKIKNITIKKSPGITEEACAAAGHTDVVESDEKNGASVPDVRPDREDGAFIASIESLTADDIAPPPAKKRDPDELRRNIIRYAAMAVFGCIFIGSAATLIRSLVGYQRGDAIYGEIADNIFSEDLSGDRDVSLMKREPQSSPLPDYYSGLSGGGANAGDTEEGEVNAEFEQMKANLTYLRSQNPDIYGYIHIDGTNISYPIVQGEDNEYYLNRTWNGEYVVVGSIYADFRADRTLTNNRNTVFYGHNMRDGKMFNNVMNFLEEDVFYNKEILIYTFDGVYTFEPFSIFQTVYTYQYFRMEFADDADFIAFCEEMQEQSVHNKNMTFTGEDRVITLSTCTPSDDPSTYYVGRYALHAKLVKVES